MNPANFLDKAEQLYSDGKIEEASESITAYRMWRMAGGFEPENGDMKCVRLERAMLGEGYPAFAFSDEDNGAFADDPFLLQESNPV